MKCALRYSCMLLVFAAVAVVHGCDSNDDGVLICTDWGECDLIPPVEYIVPIDPSPEGLEKDTPYIISSQSAFSKHFGTYKGLEKINFRKYKLVFIHATSPSQPVEIYRKIFRDGDTYNIELYVVPGIASSPIDWNYGLLVPAGYPDDKIKLSFDYHYDFEWVEYEEFDLPAGPKSKLQDDTVHIFGSEEQFREVFGYSPDGIDFSTHTLLYMQGVTTQGIDKTKLHILKFDDTMYGARMDITLNDAQVITRWNKAVVVEGDFADKFIDFRIN